MKTANQRTRALVELVDLYPALADLAGLPLPAHLEGTSFKPLLENPGHAWKTAAFSQYLRPGKPPFMGRTIRTDRWRYTEWTDPKHQSAGIELYDHTSDPDETRNIAADPAQAEVVAHLSAQLKAGWKAAQPTAK
jgi:arylsulfatase A-like enzyme